MTRMRLRLAREFATASDRPQRRPLVSSHRPKGRRTRILPLARAFARPAIVILEKPTAARLVVEEPSYLGTATSTLPPDKDPRASGGIRRRTSSHPALAGLARWFPLRQDHPALVVLRQFSVRWPTPAARS